MTLRWSSWRNYSYAPWGSRSTPLIFSCGKIKCALRIKYCQLFYPFSISSQGIYLGFSSRNHFFKIFGGHRSFLWGHWYPCFWLLVTSPLGFKARVGSLIHTWQRCNVIYVPWDSPLAQPLPTSWGSAWQLSKSLPHTFIQELVGLEWQSYHTTVLLTELCIEFMKLSNIMWLM